MGNSMRAPVGIALQVLQTTRVAPLVEIEAVGEDSYEALQTEDRGVMGGVMA